MAQSNGLRFPSESVLSTLEPTGAEISAKESEIFPLPKDPGTRILGVLKDVMEN